MKWLLLIFVALILVVAIALGGGLGFLLNVKTDVNDPNFAAKFQQSMTGLCLQQAKSHVRGAGQTLDYQQEALVKQVCDCQMKSFMKVLAKRNAKTPAEIQKAANESEREMDAAFESCAASYGLQ